MKWTQKAMREVVGEKRADLGLDGVEPLDRSALAAKHGIEVFPSGGLADFGIGEPALHHFLVDQTTAWSAALVPLGAARIIVSMVDDVDVQDAGHRGHAVVDGSTPLQRSHADHGRGDDWTGVVGHLADFTQFNSMFNCRSRFTQFSSMFNCRRWSRSYVLDDITAAHCDLLGAGADRPFRPLNQGSVFR